jgi:hypothetical protein
MPFRRVFYPDFVLPPEGGGDFDPVATFFSGGESGLITDLSSLSNLWQNTDGTGAVTAVNDPIGRIDDVSGNANHLTSVSAKGLLKQDSNGKYYVDTNNGAFYELNSPMANLRSVSIVMSDEGSSSYTPLVGDPSQYHFHGHSTAGIMLGTSYASPAVSGGTWKKDGVGVDPTTETYPTSPGVVSVITTGSVSGGYISRDRSFNGRELRGRIYEVFLNSADVGATDMESYRAHLTSKFSL